MFSIHGPPQLCEATPCITPCLVFRTFLFLLSLCIDSFVLSFFLSSSSLFLSLSLSLFLSLSLSLSLFLSQSLSVQLWLRCWPACPCRRPDCSGTAGIFIIWQQEVSSSSLHASCYSSSTSPLRIMFYFCLDKTQENTKNYCVY